MQARTQDLEAEVASATLQLQQLESSQKMLEARNSLLEAFTAANQQVRLIDRPIMI